LREIAQHVAAKSCARLSLSITMKLTVRSSGANTGGVWVVARALPLEIGTKLVGIADLSDFATLVKEDGSAITTVPAPGSQIDVKDVYLRRFHRSEGEGKERVYSPTPSFALELIVA